MRNPSEDRTPLDRASFYIESLKYGERPGRLEPWSVEGLAAELEVLLRDAHVTSMDGPALAAAAQYYGESFAEQMPGLPLPIAFSIFVDGLMHGIALAAGLHGEPRNPKGR